MSIIGLCRFYFIHETPADVQCGIVVDETLHVIPQVDFAGLTLTRICDSESPIDTAKGLAERCEKRLPLSSQEIAWLSPFERQEVWGTGMTYHKDVDPSQSGLSLYDQSYLSDRPFFFFKSSGHATAGSGGVVRVRPDSSNTISEPELTVVISSKNQIVGYTIGSDVTARDIEWKNPLYQSLSKSYDGCCAAGPWIRLCSFEDLRNSTIRTRQVRGTEVVFQGETNLSKMVKSPEVIADWFLKGGSRTYGSAILTGNGVAFPTDLTLLPGDLIVHEIEGLGIQETKVV
ncbi:fumarylacetoacetate hydrolase family protein [Planctomicrobium sp. SH668]|uniref:fumarylacetoacetate hydrolase family protein n=1 Tax=Planctomicrobium sp. SH668 TaxID=3448126 RepID=UPI003F5C4BCB